MADRDVEAAMALGTALVRGPGAKAKAAAQEWFWYAATLDPSVDLLWRITEPAQFWMRRAVTAEWADCEYVVERTVFPFYDWWDDGRIRAAVAGVLRRTFATETR